jgi:hypothetical protein
LRYEWLAEFQADSRITGQPQHISIKSQFLLKGQAGLWIVQLGQQDSRAPEAAAPVEPHAFQNFERRLKRLGGMLWWYVGGHMAGLNQFPMSV